MKDIFRHFLQCERILDLIRQRHAVGNEDAVEMVDGFFDGGEARERFALAKPGVHEESGALRLE